MNLLTRFLLSSGAIGACSWANASLTPAASAAGAKAAALQMQATDAAAQAAAAGMAASSWMTIPTGALLLVLVALWWKPLLRLVGPASSPRVLGLLVAGLILAGSGQANAYFETSDKTEAYTVLPNESAFWIPDTGDKSGQVQFDSEAFYAEKKIAQLRYVIKHHKLDGTGGMLGWDAYVPDGRLIILDRSPYSKEWVASGHRGSSARDESIPCQSKEGINITTGVSISTSVSQADASRFLARFGVQPPKGDRMDPKVIFTSVYFGRSLSDVMDDVIRKKVQTLVCKEITTRGFDKANDEAATIMDNVEKNLKEYLKPMGITLEFIGWADTFGFDPNVQKAINDRYEAEKVGGQLAALQTMADIKVKEGLGTGLATKGLPSTFTVLSGQMMGALNNLFGTGVSAKDAKAQP